MGGSIIRQEGIVDNYHTHFPPARVVELLLLLPLNQFSALEVVASRLNLTVGQLLRCTISDFLRQPLPATDWGTDTR
jgi:hypothetical protein